MAFLKEKRELRKINLCGNELPWVNDIKHLGSIITNESDMMGNDIKRKRASYINWNNEIIQEFHFAHQRLKLITRLTRVFMEAYFGIFLAPSHEDPLSRGSKWK